MFETVRIIKKLTPTYVIWENVKNVLSKRHKDTFQKYLNYMEELGYTNYYKVLNAKDYGIPQNRERVFVVSVDKKKLGNPDFVYEFPLPMQLEKCLADLLEDEVDEKYYLSDKQVTRYVSE